MSDARGRRYRTVNAEGRGRSLRDRWKTGNTSPQPPGETKFVRELLAQSRELLNQMQDTRPVTSWVGARLVSSQLALLSWLCAAGWTSDSVYLFCVLISMAAAVKAKDQSVSEWIRRMTTCDSMS
jgi:hypothetical protein